MSILTSRRITPSDLRLVREVVARSAAGEGLPRLDARRLSDGDTQHLVTCAESAVENGTGIDRSKLDRKFWAIVARGCGLDAGHFERQAREARDAAKAARRDAEQRRLRLSRKQEQGLLHAFYEELAGDGMWIDDVAAVTAIAAMFAAGKTLAPASRFEGSGDDLTLVIDIRWGLLGRAHGEGGLDGYMQRLDYLCGEGWFKVAKSGPTWRVRLGPRLRGVLELPTIEDGGAS